MKTLIPVFVWVVALLSAVAVRSADTEKTPQEIENLAKELVRKLGHPKFREREAASQELAKLGLGALKAIEEGRKDLNPEIVVRCERLRESIFSMIAKSINGSWKMTRYNGNGKWLAPSDAYRSADWVIDGEKVIIGNDTKPLTFRDTKRPELRKFDGLPAATMLVDENLYFCYARIGDWKVTQCVTGPGFDLYVFEPVNGGIIAKALIGKWKSEPEGQGSMEFTKDGKYKETNTKGEVTNEGTYKFVNNDIFIGSMMQYKIFVSKLTKTELVFTKIFDGPKKQQKFTRKSTE